MDGAGSFGAGLGPAGYSPVRAPSAQLRSTPPRAISFDPVARDWKTTNGLYDAIDPIDQQVELALFIELGSLKSAPTVGATYRTELRRIDPKQAPARALDITQRALARLIQGNKVQLVSVLTDTSVRGQIKVAVTYLNLRTKKVVTKNVNPPQKAA